MELNWSEALTDQVDWYWRYLFLPRLEGLTDDEYLWEPVAGCWSVRPDADGEFRVDGAPGEQAPPPFTTIAWRVAHIGGGVLGARAANQFGDGYDVGRVRWPGTATDGVEFLRSAYSAWYDGISGLDDAGLERPCGPTEGPFRHHPLATLVLHVNREVFHHAGEIGVLRDLYRDLGVRP